MKVLNDISRAGQTANIWGGGAGVRENQSIGLLPNVLGPHTRLHSTKFVNGYFIRDSFEKPFAASRRLFLVILFITLKIDAM